ncbi:MAG TPA: hypothetical protein VEW74_07345 [Candidatus Nitrosotalea sp.]|nr:hypothetical protein [Candidatus Nitrosotalea sp.]
MKRPPAVANFVFLLTDGRILAQSTSLGNWFTYSPDANGDYSDGTWTQVASLPSGYAPDAYAGDVLADGRLALIGGEYNQGQFALTNLGAVYDPVKNTWTPLGHPKGWGWIGDSPSSVLPDGRVLVGDKLHKWDAALDPKTLKWTKLSDSGKNDFNAEEGWTLLPDGTILTADVKKDPNSEIYDPTAQTWKSAGSTVVKLANHWYSGGCIPYGSKPKDCYYPPGEIGPSILRPDGTVFYAGSFQGASYGPGHTAIYHTSGSLAGTWTAGPDFPNRDNAGDSFAVLEANGNVMVFGDSGTIYEWDGTNLTPLSGVPYCTPIDAPTGQVLLFCSSSVYVYTPTGSPKSSWAPTVKKVPTKLAAGKTYKVTGTQFNGLSQAMSFGDEYQNATNYPLVRIVNNKSGHVFYARTHDHSTMGVATGSKIVWTYFDVPSTIDNGSSTLVVVANGIASKAINVTISGGRRSREASNL